MSFFRSAAIPILLLATGCESPLQQPVGTVQMVLGPPQWVILYGDGTDIVRVGAEEMSDLHLLGDDVSSDTVMVAATGPFRGLAGASHAGHLVVAWSKEERVRFARSGWHATQAKLVREANVAVTTPSIESYDGRIWIAWGEEHTVRVATSEDNGSTWNPGAFRHFEQRVDAVDLFPSGDRMLLAVVLRGEGSPADLIVTRVYSGDDDTQGDEDPGYGLGWNYHSLPGLALQDGADISIAVSGSRLSAGLTVQGVPTLMNADLDAGWRPQWLPERRPLTFKSGPGPPSRTALIGVAYEDDVLHAVFTSHPLIGKVYLRHATMGTDVGVLWGVVEDPGKTLYGLDLVHHRPLRFAP